MVILFTGLIRLLGAEAFVAVLDRAVFRETGFRRTSGRGVRFLPASFCLARSSYDRMPVKM
jgi:hypothetical protein